MCTQIWRLCISTSDVATCVCVCVHLNGMYTCCIQLRHLCVVCACHCRQPSVYNSVHESHEAHTPHNTVTASTSVRPWCVGDRARRRFTCACLSIAETRASTSSVCAYVRRFTLSVDVCCIFTNTLKGNII